MFRSLFSVRWEIGVFAVGCGVDSWSLSFIYLAILFHLSEKITPGNSRAQYTYCRGLVEMCAIRDGGLDAEFHGKSPRVA